MVSGIFKKLVYKYRRMRHRFSGAEVSPVCRIGRGCEFSGKVTIGHDVRIDNDVRIGGAVNIGRGAFIQRGVSIAGNIDIGENTVVGVYTILATSPHGRLSIGNDVLVNSFSNLGANTSVVIKDHCIFASYVQITDATHGYDEPGELTKHAETTAEPVVVEKNVWLGSAVMIMKGVTVGEGSVIGAKSLVNKSIPPMSIAFGIPAKVSKKRG